MAVRVLGLALLCVVGLVHGQSNYASHANNVEYQGEGLPEQTILDGKVTKLDDLSPVIFLNRTKALLNCAAGVMQAELKFNEPFYGIVFADFDRNSACSLTGKGNLSYTLELPLKGCGTKQSPQRVFTNNIVVRFHPSLEMDGDETITIVCRYPPPIAPLPAALPAPILEPIPPPPPVGQALSGYHVLLIICAILFLSLVLLGLGCSYYCMKNRKVQVVHRHPFSSVGTGSEITKLSGSSLGNISMFEGLKIPRAHAPPISTSGSEQQLIASEHSDTLPSDYPSESPSSGHSEVEDIDIRSMGSYQNQAFVPEPRFDVQVRVKRAPPPPPISPSLSSSDAESVMLQQARNLTTILEREESVRSLDSVPRPVVIAHVPEIHAAPVYSTIRKEHVQAESALDMVNTAIKSTPVRGLGVERIETNKTEVLTTSKRPAPPPPSILPYRSEVDADVVEAPVVVSPRPQLTSHVVDDVFLRTITEKKTIEDIERHKRLVTEYHAKPLPISSKWDVTIRNFPAPGQEGPREPGSDWDTQSETSTASTMAHAPMTERHHSQVNIERSYLSKLEIPPPSPPVQNWDTLVRVLDPTPQIYTTTEEIRIEEPAVNILTTADREKWRQIITTESTLRTLLTEATIREDYEVIRKDQRYEKLFEPQKWDVIIRILAPPDKVTYDKNGQPNVVRYRKKQDWDNRSRRSSLPTLYEYDSDGSSVRTLTNDVPPPGGFHDLRSRRTSRSSFRSDGIDVRSMTEVMVDYSRPDRVDTMSDVSSRPSSYYRQSRQYSDDEEAYGYTRGSMVRSLSQPSLARSASEFMEHWGTRKWDNDTDPSSPEHSPKSVRSGRTSIAGSTVSTQRKRQAIINRTLGQNTPYGLSRSSESVLDPNEGITPFSLRERELFEASRSSRQAMQALSRSAGRLDEEESRHMMQQTNQGSSSQQVVFSRSSRSVQQSTSQSGGSVVSSKRQILR